MLKKNILSKFRKAQEKEETDKSQQDDEGAIYDSRKDYEDDMHLLRRLGSNEFGGGPSSVASTNNARLAMADITAERAKEKRKAALAVKYSSNPLEKMRRDKKRKERDKQREIEKQKQREKEAFKAAPGKPMLSRALTSTLDMALLNSNNTESDTDDEDLKLVTIETIAKVNKKVHEDREVQRKDHEFHKMRERGRDRDQIGGMITITSPFSRMKSTSLMPSRKSTTMKQLNDKQSSREPRKGETCNRRPYAQPKSLDSWRKVRMFSS